ncbi:MAG: T9SS type A sorting domain-containing protein [Bacteroidetes bacterium]|nr:T9SS type A sorting domain-containing protein [Bacteroidota bacterium]
MKKILLLSFALLSSFLMQAQVPEFYNTFASNLNNNYPLQSSTYRKAQWIFGPNEFNAGGTGIGSAAYFGNISKIFIKMGTGVSSNPYTNFTISLSQNVGTSLSFGNTPGGSYNFVTGMTTMFFQASGFALTGAAASSWYGINLNGSFPYNPNLSLVLEIKVSGGLGNSLSLTNGALQDRMFGGFASTVGTTASGKLNFGFNMIATPLPVNLASFTGEKASTCDNLQWTTSDEQNCDYFNLQHGIDGIHFTNIAKVNTKAENGNSSSTLNYEFNYSSPKAGHNYYRLEQVDIDGKASILGNIIDLERDETGNSISVYPNPASDIIHAEVYCKGNYQIHLSIIDVKGKVIRETKVAGQQGLNSLQMNLDQIEAGNYILKVSDKHGMNISRKFLKK